MITLTRLSGTVFALNCDLIERVDATPDTVVTLVDGKKYVVVESLEDVIDAVLHHRGEVLAMGTALEQEIAAGTQRRQHPHLGVVAEHPAVRHGRPAEETEA